MATFQEFTQANMPTQTRINEAAGGGPWMGFNRATNKWEPIVQWNDYSNPDNPRLGLQGWESENIGFNLGDAGGGYITGVTRDDSGFGDAFGDFMSGAAPLIGLAGLGLGLGGAFGSLGGLAETGAGEMFGLTGLEGSNLAVPGSFTGFQGNLFNGIGDLPWGVNPQGGGMTFDVGSYDPLDPFNFAGDVAPNIGTNIGSGGGVENFLPGGSFSPYGPGGLVDLGGSGAIAGVDLGGGANILSSLTQKVGETAAKSLFQRFMSGDASALDVLGAAAPGLISEYFNNQRSDQLSSTLQQIADQARADRAPFLDYAKNSLAGGVEGYAAGPGKGALDAVLRGLSVKGNPFGNPTSLKLAEDAALTNWGNDWRQAANIGLGGNYSQLASNAAMAGAPTSGAGFGDAAASVFGAPKTDLASLWKSLQMLGVT